MSTRRSELVWLGLAATLVLGCASGSGLGSAPAPEPADGAAAPQTIVETSEPVPEGLDWIGLWTELAGSGDAPPDGSAAKAALCVSGCEGAGPYLVRVERDATAIELWAVAVRNGVRVRAPAARVATDPECASTIAELEFAEDVGGVALYLAVDLVVPPAQSPGPAACATKRVECQTYIEDAELVAGGPPSPDWACTFD